MPPSIGSAFSRSCRETAIPKLGEVTMIASTCGARLRIDPLTKRRSRSLQVLVAKLLVTSSGLSPRWCCPCVRLMRDAREVNARSCQHCQGDDWLVDRWD